jgi:hypothetical protein
MREAIWLGSAFAQIRRDHRLKWFTQRQTVSQETMLPRSANKS